MTTKMQNGSGVYGNINSNVRRTSSSSSSNSSDVVKKEVNIVKLKKQITLFHAVCIIVGIIIGSGIFVSPVGILKNVKSVGMSIVMWAVCGIFSALCALCFAELGTTFPESGGEYTYIKRAFGDFPAFLALWINFIIVCPVCIAASCLIFATYVLRPFFPDCDPPIISVRLIAAAVIVLLILVNCVNVQWATKIQIVITSSKLIALIMVIIIGFVYMAQGSVENFKDSFSGSDFSAGAISISFYSGFWAFGGWNYLNYLTDELINPNRNLPLAIIISMLIVTVIYIVANIAYFSILSPTEMLRSSAVAVTFAEQTVGVIAWIMPILIAISVMGSMNGTSLSMSRLFFVGAKNNHLPKFISMITFKYLTPAPSLLTILVLTLIMQSFEEIFFLIEMMGFGFAIVLTCVFAGQIYMRIREPDLPRPIKLPIVLPVFLFLVSIVILVLTCVQKPSESLLALILIVCGIPLYFICVQWESKPRGIESIFGAATRVIQKILLVVPQDKDTEW